MSDTVESLTPGFGVAITGWSGDTDLLAALLERHHLVVLQRVNWSEPQQLEVTRALGPVVARRPSRLRRVVENVRVELGADLYSDRWHADLSWSSTDAVSVLSCTQGEPDAEPTSFADTSALFDRLDSLPEVAALIETIENCTVRHDLENSRGLRPAARSASLDAHSVRRQPSSQRRSFDRSAMVLPRSGGPHGTDHQLVDATEDGRRFLRIGDHAWSIDGLSVEEATGVLERLIAAATAPPFVYTHHWVAGDVVLYDNRMMLHRRCGSAGTDPRRQLLRTMAARPSAQPTSEGVTQL